MKEYYNNTYIVYGMVGSQLYSEWRSLPVQ